MRVVPDFTLSRRLLVTVAATPADERLDSFALAQSLSARPPAVNAALAGLAEAGLIEGLWTGRRWTRLQLTPRGESRAGLSGRSPLPSSSRISTELQASVAAATARVRPLASAAAAEVSAELRSIPPALARFKEQAAPRAAAVRVRAAETYRLFTSFP